MASADGKRLSRGHNYPDGGRDPAHGGLLFTPRDGGAKR